MLACLLKFYLDIRCPFKSLMRLLLSLKAIQDQEYDNNYNYKVQSFFYKLIRNSQFHHLHDFDGKDKENLIPGHIKQHYRE